MNPASADAGSCDYLIIGAGSAGCVLANRLSANPDNRVCLLEAGPPDRNPFIHIPIGLLWMMISRTLNWRYHTEPQTYLDQRRLFWPRGKVLGGSSSSNAMIYTRGHPSDYDHWAALGNHGWSYAELLPLFKRAENFEPATNAWHGTGGPLNVASQRSPNPLSNAFVSAAQQAGFPPNEDFNGATQEGVGLYHVTQKNGERWSVARAYLHPVRNRSNLAVMTGACTTRILLENGRACGVQYLRKGKLHTLRAKREVILCGGAINSPQMLMLSGIGPADMLRRHGISVQHELPGVGQNLQDHLDVLVVQRCTQPVSLGISWRNLPAQLRHLFDYVAFRRGPWTTNSAESGGFIRSTASTPIPDLQLHFTPAHLDEHGHTLKHAADTMLGHGYALHICPLRPQSRGHISLKSADPCMDALIEPDYLSHPADMPAMISAVKIAREILAQPAFDPYRGAEIFPGDQVQSDDEIAAFIRRKAGTIYHPVGTCKMGNDAMAVVDDRLRVHGIKGLRVADASIMPTLVGGNTNAPVIVIAEKAADMILQDHT